MGLRCAAVVILSEAAMIYLANSLAALSILSLVVFIGSLFALFVKSARRRAKWLAVGGFVGFFAAGFASLPFFEHAAHEAGYSDYASQMRAEHLVDEAAERKRSEEAERKAAADEAVERERSIQAARKAAADVAYSAMNPTATYTKAGDDIEDRQKLVVTALAAALKRGMNDPDSMEWDLVTANDDGTVVCAEFRARNVFNALIAKKLAVVNGNSTEDASIWNRRCAGKPQHDLTGFAEVVWSLAPAR